MHPYPERAPSTREKVLDTAEALFARHGFAGVGMRQVAARVGIGKSSLFHHFPSKLGLYVAVLERILARIDLRLDQACETTETPTRQLRRWLGAVVDVLAENPTHAPLLLRTLFEAEVVPAAEQTELDRSLQRSLGRVASALRAGIVAGELRDVDVPHTLQTLIGMTVYHFASGEFGDELLGRPIYSAAEVRRRKEHVLRFIEQGLVLEP